MIFKHDLNTQRWNKSAIKLMLFLSFCLFCQPSVAKQNPQDAEFLKAYKALSKGKLYDSSHLRHHILHPYLEYERLKNNLKVSSNQSLMAFIHQNPNNRLGVNIRTELLKKFAEAKQWNNILKYYQKDKGSVSAKCIGLEAQLRTRPNQALYQEALKHWKSGNRRPEVCNPLFSLLAQKGLITDQLLWERITLAMKKGKTTLSRDLSKNLKNPSLVSLWVKLRRNPNKHITSKKLRKNNARNRQLIGYAIKRIARKNTKQARKHWRNFQKNHTFDTKTIAEIESYIAVRDAKDHKQSSLNDLAAIPANLRSKDANTWMARLAIRYGDWRKLRSAIQAMPHSDKKRERWQYWLAHSNKRLGNHNIQKTLRNVAQNASFYGFLAADEINAPYARLLQQEPNWSLQTHRIKNISAIQRATKLFSLNLTKPAKKEWDWAIKGLSKQDQLIAAAYALEINQPFQAIITVSKTKDWNQVGLRFPMEYEKLVKDSARKHGVIAPWVYGIMRRESAFDPVIESHAKAKGLMQVIPPTAKAVARSLGIRNHKTSDLFNPVKNANIGAAYLSQMLKKFNGNYIKATASYNAGPHRIPRWLPEKTISAPRWIESIPFDETRNYVRAVMSYTTIYDHKLNYRNGTNLRLSQRLQSIGPKK